MSLLYILPYAGGAAHSYKPIEMSLAGSVDVRCLELPGRGRRAAEPCLATWEAAVDEVARLIVPPADRPWAIFGHSMGSLLGVEVLLRRSRQNLPMPVFLAASGSPAPAARKRTQIAGLPGDAFWAEIRRYGGMPAEILAVAEFRDYFEAALRKDFAVIEDGQPGQGKLNLPIHVCYGDRDMTEDEAASWGAVTTSALNLHRFPGDHFYLFDHPRALAATMTAAFGSDG